MKVLLETYSKCLKVFNRHREGLAVEAPIGLDLRAETENSVRRAHRTLQFSRLNTMPVLKRMSTHST